MGGKRQKQFSKAKAEERIQRHLSECHSPKAATQIHSEQVVQDLAGNKTRCLTPKRPAQAAESKQTPPPSFSMLLSSPCPQETGAGPPKKEADAGPAEKILVGAESGLKLEAFHEESQRVQAR